MVVTKEIVAGLLLAAGGKGDFGAGGGDSNNDLTSWDGSKKRNGWSRQKVFTGVLIRLVLSFLFLENQLYSNGEAEGLWMPIRNPS